MSQHPQPNDDLADGAFFVGRLEWSGTLVDIFPVGDHTVSEMTECDLTGPVDDIYDANDTDNFDTDEHLGFVYFQTPEEYDLRVA